MKYLVFALIALALPALADERLSHTTRDGRVSPLLSNLGNFERKVSTRNADAQRFFSQGLVLIYAFNHPEAIRSFREASRNDRKLAMAYWGEALATGPNINDSAKDAEREKAAYLATRKALAYRFRASAVERALIEALAFRFIHPTGDKREARMLAYAHAMSRVYKKFPKDPDVATLYAGAVMDATPWDYYTKDGQPKPAMKPAIAALEKAIAIAPDHPGAHHYYIHVVEASSDPDRALPSALRLPSLVPAAGHLLHMPAHIFIRLGMYEEAVESNLDAVKADEDYINQCKVRASTPRVIIPTTFTSSLPRMRSRDVQGKHWNRRRTPRIIRTVRSMNPASDWRTFLQRFPNS